MKASQQDAGGHEEEKSGEAAAAPASAGVIDIELPPLDDPPASIDPNSATQDELRDACNARDTYIAYLLQRLQKIESLGHVPNSWAGLENVPDEVRTRLEALEHRLQETARVAEVELSLQRAKLAREELRVRVMDEQVQKDLKRAKNAADSQADDSGDGKGDQSGNRWKRMLGR
jgi:hypothetical protein